jgi:hypothetical protein
MLDADYSAIAGAGTGFAAAAGRLREIDVAGPFTTAQDALVGSQTSEACLWVATRLGAAVQCYADQVESMSELASATVDTYQGIDGATGAQFSAVAR